jgi:YD repeat-containing protein
MKKLTLLFITVLLATTGNTIFAQGFKYFKEIEGSTDYPVDMKGKFEISPSDTLLYRNFYRLSYKNNKVSEVYRSTLSYMEADNSYAFVTRYEFDQNGYYSKAYYYNKFGKRTSNYDVYYKNFTCDTRGNIVEISDFNKNGKQIEDWNGTALIRNVFNDRNQKIESSNYDKNNQLVGEYDYTTATTKYEYDNNGFVSKISYYNSKGDYTSDYAAVKYKNDARGNVIETIYLDADGANYYESVTKNEYNEKNQMTRTAEYDLDGNLYDAYGYGASSNYIYDSKGNVIETRTYDDQGQLIADYTAITKYTYDVNGDIIQTAYFNADNSPSSDYNGVAVSKSTYDNRHNCLETATYDEYNELVSDYDGVAIYRYKFDANNYCIETARYGTDGELTDDDYYPAIERKTYDAKGNLLEKAAYDVFGELKTDSYSSVAITKYKYDADGNQIEVATYGTDGELIGDYSEIAIERNTYDEQGNVIETSKYGTDGELYDPYGYGATFKYKYDANNYKIEERIFGNDGELLKDEACITKYKYDERGNTIEQASYGDDERLLEDEYSGVAIYRYIFDENNRIIEESKYGADDRLVSSDDDYYSDPTIAITRYKFDENGNEIERAYFDSNEEYVADYYGVAILRQKYDNNSRVIEKANYNEYQELLNDEYSYEYPLVRYKYLDDEYADDFWAPTEEAIYDAEGMLKNLKKYDGYDVIEESFYQNNILKNNENGIAIIRNEYEEIYIDYYYDYGYGEDDYSSEGYFNNEIVRTLNYDQYENFVSGIKYEYDASGYVQVEESIDENGKSVNNSEGYCRKDISTGMYYNAKGKEVPVSKILAKKVKSYKVVKMDENGYTVFEEYYNLKGKKVNNDEGYHMYDAINYKYYDKKGREVYYNYDTGLYE